MSEKIRKPSEEVQVEAIKIANAAGAEALSAFRGGEEKVKDFALRAAIALKLAPRELQKQIEAEGVATTKAKKKRSTAVSYLTGYYRVAESKTLDKSEKTRLSKQVSYMAELTEAIELFIVSEKLPVTGAQGEFEKIREQRDAMGVSAILTKLQKSRRAKIQSGANETKLNDSDLLQRFAAAYQSAQDPVATFAAPGIQIPQDGLAFGLLQDGSDGKIDVYDVVVPKTKFSVDLLREVETLPSANEDERINFALDILHVGSKTCPDRPSPSSPVGIGSTSKKAKKIENFRQFLFDPASDAIFVGYARQTGLPTIKVGGLSHWPDAPHACGLLNTAQRRKVDKVANRFDRIKQVLQTCHREEGQKWLTKFLLTPQGAEGGLPLQVDPFEGHNLDFFRPNPAEAKWEVEFNFDRSQMRQIWLDHLRPYSESGKSEKEARIVTLSFSKQSATFVYPGIQPVVIDCDIATPPKKKTDIQIIGKDLAEVVAGIIALNVADPVKARADARGLISLSVQSGHTPYEFYLSTVSPGSSERSDRFFTSVKHELEYAESDAEEAA